MRTRANDWLDTNTLETKYGIDVLHDGKWKHLAEDGKPCIYSTPAERDAKRPIGTHQIGFHDQRGPEKNKPTLRKREANATPLAFRDELLRLALHSAT